MIDTPVTTLDPDLSPEASSQWDITLAGLDFQNFSKSDAQQATRIFRTELENGLIQINPETFHAKTNIKPYGSLRLSYRELENPRLLGKALAKHILEQLVP